MEATKFRTGYAGLKKEAAEDESTAPSKLDQWIESFMRVFTVSVWVMISIFSVWFILQMIAVGWIG